VQTNKSDRADARAICRAVQEPGMRFVRLAHEEQQARSNKRCKPATASAAASSTIGPR
jgi:transposase